MAELLPQVQPSAPDFVDSLLRAFRGAGSEGPPAAPQAPSRAASPIAEPLSERELEVLRLLADGQSNAEIARALVVTVGTAKWHVHHLLGKLGAANRTQAVARARELNLL